MLLLATSLMTPTDGGGGMFGRSNDVAAGVANRTLDSVLQLAQLTICHGNACLWPNFSVVGSFCIKRNR